MAGLAAGPVLSAARSLPRADSTSPTINTTYGSVQGTTSAYRDNITVYKGIPYAAPPTGSSRWTPPSAPEAWTDVYNASSFGADCAQSYSAAGIFSSGSENISEDCLYLNIWTPTYNDTTDLTSQNLPVFFWIYGGRFSGGAGSVPTYDGSGLAAKDIIVVTINYRLGPFGFLAHPDLSAESAYNASGNYGLLDQQFALQWVHDNIANFGGNPDQIVVGGQSAGSASALDIMWSPLSRDLIAGVIAESGARGPNDPVTGSAATSWRNRTAAEAEGVDFVANSLNVSTIAEARNLSMDTLLTYDSLGDDTIFDGTQFENLTSAFMAPPLWRPVIDGYVLIYSYSEALRTGDHGDVPILTGNNKDESGASPDTDYTTDEYTTDYTEMFGNFSTEFLELYPGDNETQASDNSNELFRDMSRVGTWLWSVDWAAGGAKSNVYTYYFTHAPEESESSGAYHGAELWYTFNNIPYADFNTTDVWNSTDYAIESVMSDYWANFIRTGNPNGDNTTSGTNLTYWPPSTNASKQTMWLGDAWGPGEISDSDDRISFLESWYATLQEW
ncbi:alpha/beta-hydrolase [Stereum hirsutum FP-91666 SS1]|uniref:alpha/beta-hydrolase n=1 Tax=Stereum hirsutum (strain FP-91666) TaxID=721885 RepID=UPI000444A325|nr:alpha/beta-hydrolase [Stereum hirsutum FP-91666 SS1]EIM85602.1 alpha/beta-hydrolase [Stereum hirsutum FP-91666 SS1]